MRRIYGVFCVAPVPPWAEGPVRGNSRGCRAFDGAQGAANEERSDKEAKGDEGDPNSNEAVLEGGEFFLVGLKRRAADDDAPPW